MPDFESGDHGAEPCSGTILENFEVVRFELLRCKRQKYSGRYFSSKPICGSEIGVTSSPPTRQRHDNLTGTPQPEQVRWACNGDFGKLIGSRRGRRKQFAPPCSPCSALWVGPKTGSTPVTFLRNPGWHWASPEPFSLAVLRQ